MSMPLQLWCPNMVRLTSTAALDQSTSTTIGDDSFLSTTDSHSLYDTTAYSHHGISTPSDKRVFPPAYHCVNVRWLEEWLQTLVRNETRLWSQERGSAHTVQLWTYVDTIADVNGGAETWSRAIWSLISSTKKRDHLASQDSSKFYISNIILDMRRSTVYGSASRAIQSRRNEMESLRSTTQYVLAISVKTCRHQSWILKSNREPLIAWVGSSSSCTCIPKPLARFESSITPLITFLYWTSRKLTIN